MAGSVASGIRAGKTFVEMALNDEALQKGLKGVQASLGNFGTSIAKIGATLGGAGLALTAPILAASEKFAESGSKLANASARTGLAVESLSALSFAAKMTGTDLEGVETGIRRMQKSLTAGSLENEMAAQSFQQLGLSVESLVKLSPDEQFNRIAAAIAKIPNPTAKAGAAMQIFGRSGSMLVPLIDNFQELSAEAKEFGLVTSAESAESALKLQRSTNLLNAALGKIVTTIGSAVAPAWTAWNIQMAHAVKVIKDVVANNKPLILGIYSLGFTLTVAGSALLGVSAATFLLKSAMRGLGTTVGLVVKTLKLIPVAFALLTSPIGLVVAGLVTLGYYFLTVSETGKKMAASFKKTFDMIAKDASVAFKGISDALSVGDTALAMDIFFKELELVQLTGLQALKKHWNDYFSWVSNEFSTHSDQLAFYGLVIQSAFKKAGKAAIFDVKGLGQEEKDFRQTIQNLKEDIADKNSGAKADREDAKALEAILEARKKLKELAGDAAAKAAREKKGLLDGTDLDPNTPAVKGKVEVQGTFGRLSGLAIGQDARYGLEKTAGNQLTEQKKTTKELEKLNRKAAISRLVFGS